MKKNVLILIILWVNLCVMMVACSKEDELLIGIEETNDCIKTVYVPWWCGTYLSCSFRI